eukprot:tig00000042_g15461.t1
MAASAFQLTAAAPAAPSRVHAGHAFKLHTACCSTAAPAARQAQPLVRPSFLGQWSFQADRFILQQRTRALPPAIGAGGVAGLRAQANEVVVADSDCALDPVMAEGVQIVEYADLLAGRDITEQIRLAYGEGGLGILLVRGIPGFSEKRSRLLPLARDLARLPQGDLDALERPEFKYSIGWSHGKERLEGGRLDTAKGSFYANPISDEPAHDADAATVARHIDQFAANVWPRSSLPDLEAAFKDAGGTLVEVGRLILAAADGYVRREMGAAYEPGRLARAVSHRECAMGRLLHYFPRSREELESGAAAGRWCGWHTDHSAITGLYSALFLDPEGRPVPCPDPSAGLYIRNRAGEVVKVAIPPDMAAFQIGESAQVLSGGALRATPHCVQGPSTVECAGISRNTLAVFVQPRWNEPMSAPDGIDARAVRVGAWRPGQSFVEFAHATVMNGYG